MARRNMTDFITYRWRYPLGYVAFLVSLGVLLFVAGLFIPGGLSEQEISSALVSNGLNASQLFSLEAEQLLFLPYNLLQAASISLLGFTSFGIKLPSLVLAFVSAGGLMVLLNIWFRKNVAIITGILAVTTSQFLLAAQSGHAGITYVFWTVSLLLAASFLARRGAAPGLWVLIGSISAGLSLYMPLNSYVLLALFMTALLHPHARHVILRVASKPTLAIGSLLFIATISPLAYAAIIEPSIVWQLLGIPESWAGVGDNARVLLSQYGSFMTPSSGSVITPVYGLATALLIVLGLFRMFSSKYTTKSYIISIWLMLLLPFVFLNPSYINITFVPVVLLMGLGVEYLIWSWYRLFPRNPYARVFGLIPLGVLVVGMTISNIDRFVYGYHYDKSIYSDYTFDLNTLDTELKALEPATSVILATDKADADLYRAYAEHQTHLASLSITTSAPTSPAPGTVLITDRRSAADVVDTPSKIIVNRASRDADRFYVYKSPEN